MSSPTQVATPCIDGHQLIPEDSTSKESSLMSALNLFWKCLYLARSGRPDLACSVDILARFVTKMRTACDKRLVQVDLLHPFYRGKQTPFPRGEQYSTLPIWLVPRRVFWWRLEWFCVNARCKVVRCGCEHLCTSILDVQEANRSISHSSAESDIISPDADWDHSVVLSSKLVSAFQRGKGQTGVGVARTAWENCWPACGWPTKARKSPTRCPRFLCLVC